MSLRTQLSLLYSLLAGVVFAAAAVIVYTLVSVLLVDQIDNTLTSTADLVMSSTRINAQGQVVVDQLPAMDVTSPRYIQVWNTAGDLISKSQNISSLQLSLDPDGLRYPKPAYRDVELNHVPLRVLSVPLQVSGRKMAALQVGTNRALVDEAQGILRTVLGIALALAILVAGLYGWLGTSLVLSPLEKVTEAARSIANKDDLSRRIPNVTRKNEIGVLIDAFNQTLDRLEDIFNKQKRFLADVSHELRTPLTVIKGNAGLLRKMKEPDEESLREIEVEVDRLTRLVGDLLLLAQAEAGKLDLHMQPVELDALLTEVLKQARVLSLDKVQIHIDEIDELKVQGDRDRLKQVLINLVTNAIKYTPVGGRVGLRLVPAGDMAQLIISDTGPGIPSNDLPHIFERFYRGDKARTRSLDGSSYGLGLSIVFWIIKNHGGDIEVKSIEGQGTTFIVSLPIYKGK
jgi:heavy metal sensor kinase